MVTRKLAGIVFVAVVMAMLIPRGAWAGNDDHRYGLGASWVGPVGVGISGIARMADMPLSIQGIIGTNDFPSPVVRARLTFWSREHLDAYAVGAIGIDVDHDGADGDSESSLFGGIGAGVEWGWRDLDRDLPPVWWSVELGLNGDDFGVGFGAHYAFNL